MTARPGRLAALIGLVGLVGLAALGFFPQEPLRRVVRSRLATMTGAEVQLARLHVVPALLRADVEGLSVVSPGLRVRIPRARVSLSAASFLTAVPTLREIVIERPEVEVRATPPGTGRGVGGAPPAFSLGRLSVTDGTLHYASPALGDVTLQGVDAFGSVGTGSLEVTVAGGAWARREPLPVGPCRARVRVSPVLDVQIDTLDVRVGASRVSARGTVGRPGTLRLAIDAFGAVSLEEAARALALDTAIAGTPTFQLRLEGPAEKATVALTLEGRSLSLAGRSIDELRARL
ncbi:MAG TPA: hypothetical protein VIC87_06285, partial [Vicinamibacteria bacterium]